MLTFPTSAFANAIYGFSLASTPVAHRLNARTFLRIGDGRGPGEGLSFELALATQPQSRGDYNGMRAGTTDLAIRTSDSSN